jgi:tetratricopeptide (TPR) repeat protein
MDKLAQVAGDMLADVPQMEQVQREMLEQALGFYTDFLRGSPTDPALRQEWARATHRLGDIYRLLGQDEQAKAAYQQAIARLEKLAAEFPDVPDFRQHLAISHNDLGELLRGASLPRDAEIHYRAALRLQQALPGRTARRELARTYNNLGILLKATSQSAEAKKAFNQEIRLLQELVEQRPEPADRAGLARGYLNLGNLEKLMGHPGDAESCYGHAIRLLEELKRNDPRVRDYQLKLALTYTNLGNLLLSLPPRQAEALRPCGRAVELYQKLADDFPRFPLYRKGLANSQNSLGLACWYAGHPRQADKSWAKALGSFEKLVADFPGQPEYESVLGMALDNSAWRLLNRLELVGFCQALGSAGPDYPGPLRLAVGTLAAGWLSREDLTRARAQFQKAVALQRAALSSNSRNPQYRDFLVHHYEFLARTWRWTDDLVEAARCLACCTLLAAQNPGASEKERTQRASGFAGEAVGLLREALRRGHLNTATLDRDKVLQALSPYPDFQAFLKALKIKAEKTP